MSLSSFHRYCLTLLVIASLCSEIFAAPTTGIDVKVDDSQQTGCLHDGKVYQEAETIVTKEPCLNCTCQSGALRCHLQVCPFLHDVYPPPAGCVLVERKNACCPKLHCPNGPDGSRLLRKDPNGQKAAWKVREDLRKRLVDQLAKNGPDNLGCVDTGTIYAEGSAMMTSSTCEYCFCLKGKQTCVKPKCAEPVEGCTPRFREFACCPTHYDCATTTNNTSVVSEKITPAERRGDRIRPILTTILNGGRGNDRVIDSSSSSNSHHQKMESEGYFRKRTLFRRSTDTVADKNQTSPQSNHTLDEPSPIVLGPDSLTESEPLSILKTFASAEKAIDRPMSNETVKDSNQSTEKVHHQDSLAMEGSVVETRVSAPTTASPTTSTTHSTDSVTEEAQETTSKTEENSIVTLAPEEELEEDEPTTEVDPLSPTSRLDNEGHDLGLDDEEQSAAERGIEVSVSSSITSVSQSSNHPMASDKVVNPAANAATSHVPAHPQTSGNFLPVDNKVAKPRPDAQQSSPVPQEQDDPLDYDYSNMELPPSLPNLEIIPFVAADAVMGVPNLEEDERLNLGGIVDQRTDSHSSNDGFSSTEYCSSGGNFYNHGELIKNEQPGQPSDDDPCNVCRCLLGQIVCHATQCAPLSSGCRRLEQPGFCCGQVVCGGTIEDRSDKLNDTLIVATNSNKADTKDKVEEEKVDESISTTTTRSPSDPIAAFRVTFPPRPVSTLPPPPSPQPTFSSRRATTSRPTARTTAATTPRSFSSIKFNKPANNNLVPPSFSATGGLRIDSCNIYGQMYRVGRIIDELSGPCVECKCTEIGVNCVNLKC